jgi:hypothetical protein
MSDLTKTGVCVARLFLFLSCYLGILSSTSTFRTLWGAFACVCLVVCGVNSVYPVCLISFLYVIYVSFVLSELVMDLAGGDISQFTPACSIIFLESE